MKTFVSICVIISIAAFGLAAAQESFGVKVYGGAKYDEVTSQAVKNMMKAEAFCYRTNDSVEKVTEFYKTQPGLKLVLADKTSAVFRKEGGIGITLQNPWVDMKTGKEIADTLISIFKKGD